MNVDVDILELSDLFLSRTQTIVVIVRSLQNVNTFLRLEVFIGMP